MFGKKYDKENAKLLQAPQEIKTTTCYMCACRCGIKVTLRNGEIRYIQGNLNHPLNKGILCAKGSSGIMKQYSPARLTKPLLRKANVERGRAEFEEISWDRVFFILADRLDHIRKTDPKQFALFTGRDQMQGLTGLFAQQFGTPNYAAHGGFCSVNMAAGMIYSIGGSFWEFGGPDLEQAKLFIMLGTAEDHHSNPLKMEISKFKRHGGYFVSVNPIRTGYSAIADEWVPIKPGTDNALLLALIREIIQNQWYDQDFLVNYTNAAELVNIDESSIEEGLLARDPSCKNSSLWWDEKNQCEVVSHSQAVTPSLFGSFTTKDGKKVKTAFQLLVERVEEYTIVWAEKITGLPAKTISQLAKRMGDVVMTQRIELPIAWTDAFGNQHSSVKGSPIAFHSMRGLAAHSNGFQTIRALSILMTLLGTIDVPGGFRHKAPYPRNIPPSSHLPHESGDIQPNQPLRGTALGWPKSPDDLMVDENGQPMRIDKGFSWEHPLSVHGLMHNVITNAWRGDPYSIDTLLIFMSNMAWNSSMNTTEIRKMLVDKNPNGQYKIPFLIVCDAFQSEMVEFADLVLPDTTYLERHDAMSMLDRPISEFDGPTDSVRIPVLPPTGECRPFQEVIVELASRLKFPAFVHPDGTRKFQNYTDFIIHYETSPGSGIGFLAGWRGVNQDKAMRGEPNPQQWDRYQENNCFFHYPLPVEHRYLRNVNQGYLQWAQQMGYVSSAEPIIIQLYSEVLQEFRLAAKGKRVGKQPPDYLRQRVVIHFDPLPFYSEPLEVQAMPDRTEYPLNAVTQRPMAMYHSWDSQNAWLRQIHSHNYLFVNPKTAKANGIQDDDWIWVESMHGKVRCMCRYSEAVEPGTVWTWNAIGKAKGAWGLTARSNESRQGFLLNHLIHEELPHQAAGIHLSNSDPVTGQAGWYDVRVKIYKADPQESPGTWPQFPGPADKIPGVKKRNPLWQRYFAGRGEFKDLEKE